MGVKTGCWLVAAVCCTLLPSTWATAENKTSLPNLYDPYIWLEVQSPETQDWVDKQNQITLEKLENVPEFPEFFDQIKKIRLGKDKTAFGYFKEGYFWNFWQDEANPRGLIRRTTAEQYTQPNPQWEVILDLDELSRKENKPWSLESYRFMRKGSHRWLISLSDGGEDKVTVREFDLDKKDFVQDGFFVPPSKGHVLALDDNHILIAADFGPGSLTNAGYPRIIKLWTRGEKLSEAKTVFEGQSTDVSVSMGFKEEEAHLEDPSKPITCIISLGINFFEEKNYLWTWPQIQRPQQLAIPSTASLIATDENFGYATLRKPIQLLRKELIPGTLIRFPLKAETLDGAEVIFVPKDKEVIHEIEVLDGEVFVNALQDIQSVVSLLKRTPQGVWESQTLPFPRGGEISLDINPERKSFTFSDYLSPRQQYLIDDQTLNFHLVKKSPTRFDSEKMRASRFEATSKDGTKIPYTVLHPKDLAFDGKAPTILYGYGGFEVSLTPSYNSTVGKVWLERGGVYVIANIRGGGEFGPEWHQAAKKENRQRAYDDFKAVGDDLIARHITSRAHLGIVGGSNGGLLVAASMVQNPGDFNAVISQVPLIDMIRYVEIGAGNSWVDEYGDPRIPAECATILKYSPYQNLKRDTKYPEPFFTTSTKDDRTGAGHARKIAARMIEQGHPVLFFESTAGGHTSSGDIESAAREQALEYAYLWKRLK